MSRGRRRKGAAEGRPAGARPRFGLLLVLLLGLLSGLLLVAGCTPKRVLRHPPHGRGGTGPEAASELPPPAGHGRMQQPKRPRDPVQELRLGYRAAEMAHQQLNKPYQWGAEGPEKFDCSGLVYYVFGSLGVQLPRVSRDQAQVGHKVTRKELQPGDLVFFVTRGKRINHVGIYIGDARFIHAPSRHNPVRSDSLNNSYWRRCFQFGRRISG